MRMIKRLTLPLAVLALLLVVAAPADAKRATNRARIHALEKKIDRLSRQIDRLTTRLEATTETADVALQAVQCTYSLPFLSDPNMGTFHLLGTDQVTEDSMWIVFAATGPNCDGTVIPA